jgi:hypothetical protein
LKFISTLEWPSTNYLLQNIKKIWKIRVPPSGSNITCGETSKLSTVSALQVNVILLKNIYWSYKNTLTFARNNRKFITCLIQK